MTKRPLLAIDAGQTEIKAVLHHDGVETPLTAPGVRTDRSVALQLADFVNTVERPQGLVVAIGASGVAGTPDEMAELRGRVAEDVAHVLLAHDSVTSYLGALGVQAGVIVASGTGTIVLAAGKDAVARVDGWGHLFGDAGSGFWLGRAGIDAVLRAFDGRGPTTALTDVVTADYPDLSTLYLELQADANRVAKVASYARKVAELAEARDFVCERICREAASELAHSAITALARVGEDNRNNPRIAMLGNVFKGAVLADEFRAQLLDRFTSPEFVTASGGGLVGAARLPELSPDSALGRLTLRG